VSAEPTERLRVLIADDHKVVREQLATLLNAEDDVQVVGLARDGAGALDQAKALTPDVLILDHNMRGLISGLDVIRALRRPQLATRVVM
jgi:DNA-binding NarL/FixJ family response regulator